MMPREEGKYRQTLYSETLVLYTRFWRAYEANSYATGCQTWNWQLGGEP